MVSKGTDPKRLVEALAISAGGQALATALALPLFRHEVVPASG